MKSLVMGKMGLNGTKTVQQLLEQDPLDHWALHVSGDIDLFLSRSRNDAQTILDVAYDYVDAGFVDESRLSSFIIQGMSRKLLSQIRCSEAR